LSTAETVPEVRPTCSATALSVTTVAAGPGLLVWAMSQLQMSRAGVTEAPTPDLSKLRKVGTNYSQPLAVFHAFAYRSLLGFDPLSAKNKM
jgi:hypothetical protein